MKSWVAYRSSSNNFPFFCKNENKDQKPTNSLKLNPSWLLEKEKNYDKSFEEFAMKHFIKFN